MKGPFSVQTIEDKKTRSGKLYRITDAEDDRVATCYLRENADEIVELLNLGWNSRIKRGGY